MLTECINLRHSNCNEYQDIPYYKGELYAVRDVIEHYYTVQHVLS